MRKRLRRLAHGRRPSTSAMRHSTAEREPYSSAKVVRALLSCPSDDDGRGIEGMARLPDSLHVDSLDRRTK
jgi:hypothetical protein